MIAGSPCVRLEKRKPLTLRNPILPTTAANEFEEDSVARKLTYDIFQLKPEATQISSPAPSFQLGSDRMFQPAGPVVQGSYTNTHEDSTTSCEHFIS